MIWWKIALAVVAPAGTGFGIYWATKKSAETKAATEDAIATGGTFQARLTGYWPFSARPDEVKMEGGVTDRKGNPLHTLEMHQQDKGAHPFVSVAGDYEIFPYGQRIAIDAWPGLTFRVVDTGGHFHGAGKLYRVAGHEPLDICVATSETKVPKLAEVTIFAGDHFDKAGKEVAASKMKGQSVTVGGLHLLGV